MAMPKVLQDIKDVRDEAITATSATLSSGAIVLTLPVDVCTGSIIKFTAPCDCSSATVGIKIGGTTYELVDASNECISGKGNKFASGAMVSVIIDTENSRAYIQNVDIGAFPIIDARENFNMNDVIRSGSHFGIYRVGVNTEGTPAKSNKTAYNYGLIISHGTSSSGIQLAFIAGAAWPFYRYLREDALTAWYAVYGENHTPTPDAIGAAKAIHASRHNRRTGSDPITFNDVAVLPMNTVPSEDTPSAWAELGSFTCYYSAAATVINKPTNYGTLIQFVQAVGEAVTLQQLWLYQGYGGIWYRAGNSTGWRDDATVSGADAWTKCHNDRDSYTWFNNQTSRIYSAGGILQIDNYTDKYTGDTDVDDRLLLMMRSDTETISNWLRMARRVGGNETYYRIYGAHNITAGTSDLTSGSSALATGSIYQMYT